MDKRMAAKHSQTEIEQIANHYAELLKRELNIHEAYLFGSYAKGKASADSDIDIAVVGDCFTGDLVEDRLKLMQIRRQIDHRIEPHPFLPSEFMDTDPFVKSIVEEGIRLKTDPEPSNEKDLLEIAGVLSATRASELGEHIKKSRKEWDNDDAQIPYDDESKK